MNVIQGPKPCERIQPMLDSYVSNELLVETTHEVMRHLEGCPNCQFALEQKVKARKLLRSAMANVEVPPDLRVRVKASLERPVAPVLPLSGWNVGWMQAAAAVVMVLFAGLMFQVLVRDPGRIAGLLNLGWEHHVECTLVGHNYPATPPAREKMVHDLGKQYEGLLPVVEKQLPDYQIRTAHVCRNEGRRFAHVVLQKGNSIVSVSMVKRADSGAFPDGKWREILSRTDQKLQSGVRDGGGIAAFQTESHVAFVMGNAERTELERVALVMKSQVSGLGL